MPPTGDYVLEFVVTSDSGVGWEAVGASATAPWNSIGLDCSSDPCQGRVPFDDADGSATFDGSTLQVTGTSQAVFNWVDDQTGEVVAGASATVGIAFTGVATVSGTSAGGRPTMADSMEVTWTTLSTTGNCEPEPTGTTRDITLTPA